MLLISHLTIVKDVVWSRDLQTDRGLPYLIAMFNKSGRLKKNRTHTNNIVAWLGNIGDFEAREIADGITSTGLQISWNCKLVYFIIMPNAMIRSHKNKNSTQCTMITTNTNWWCIQIKSDSTCWVIKNIRSTFSQLLYTECCREVMTNFRRGNQRKCLQFKPRSWQTPSSKWDLLYCDIIDLKREKGNFRR